MLTCERYKKRRRSSRQCRRRREEELTMSGVGIGLRREEARVAHEMRGEIGFDPRRKK